MGENERKALSDALMKASTDLQLWTKIHTKFPWTLEEETECRELLKEFDLTSKALDKFDRGHGNG